MKFKQVVTFIFSLYQTMNLQLHHSLKKILMLLYEQKHTQICLLQPSLHQKETSHLSKTSQGEADCVAKQALIQQAKNKYMHIL